MSEATRLIEELTWLLSEEYDPSVHGTWVTVRGRPILLRGASPEDLDKLKPSEKPKTVKTTRKRKDGSEFTQVTYDPEWIKKASLYKHTVVATLAENSPRIEAAVRFEMEDPEPSEKKATATCVHLMMSTGMRVGDPKGGLTKGKRTYGAVDLEAHHVKIEGNKVRIRYTGKAGVKHDDTVEDAGLAKSMSELMKGKSGKEKIFGWGGKHLTPGHVSERLKEFNRHYKPKDLRTLVALETASDVAQKLLKKKFKKPKTEKDHVKLAKEIARAISGAVSKKLGNTPAVALHKYTDPHVVEHVLQHHGVNPPAAKDEAKESKKDEPVKGQLALKIGADALKEPKSKQLPLLTRIFGKDFMNSWEGAFADDDHDEDD